MGVLLGPFFFRSAFPLAGLMEPAALLLLLARVLEMVLAFSFCQASRGMDGMHAPQLAK